MASFPASTTSASAYALTTAFSAPTQCAESVGGLTMLERDQFRIWLNHPLPVPLTTISSCYPTQFMSSFLLQTSGVSQVAFSPLVCPVGYTTQGIYTSNYIACCPRFVVHDRHCAMFLSLTSDYQRLWLCSSVESAI
jgi:hypothetical protein